MIISTYDNDFVFRALSFCGTCFIDFNNCSNSDILSISLFGLRVNDSFVGLVTISSSAVEK